MSPNPKIVQLIPSVDEEKPGVSLAGITAATPGLAELLCKALGSLTAPECPIGGECLYRYLFHPQGLAIVHERAVALGKADPIPITLEWYYGDFDYAYATGWEWKHTVQFQTGTGYFIRNWRGCSDQTFGSAPSEATVASDGTDITSTVGKRIQLVYAMKNGVFLLKPHGYCSTSDGTVSDDPDTPIDVIKIGGGSVAVVRIIGASQGPSGIASDSPIAKPIIKVALSDGTEKTVDLSQTDSAQEVYIVAPLPATVQIRSPKASAGVQTHAVAVYAV